MGIKDLLKKTFTRTSKDKRVADRKRLKEFYKIQFVIQDVKFRFKDFSATGIGLVNEGALDLLVGSIYTADLIAYGQKKASIKLKVVRKDASVIGCEILDQDIFKDFEENYLVQTIRK